LSLATKTAGSGTVTAAKALTTCIDGVAVIVSVQIIIVIIVVIIVVVMVTADAGDAMLTTHACRRR